MYHNGPVGGYYYNHYRYNGNTELEALQGGITFRLSTFLYIYTVRILESKMIYPLHGLIMKSL